MSFKDFLIFFSSIGYFVRRSGTICANLVEAGEIISNLNESCVVSIFFSLNDSPCRQYFFFSLNDIPCRLKSFKEKKY